MNISTGDLLKIGGVIFAAAVFYVSADFTHDALASKDETQDERIERIEKATDAQQRRNKLAEDIAERNKKLLQFCQHQGIPRTDCPLEEKP